MIGKSALIYGSSETGRLTYGTAPARRWHA